MWIQNKGYRLMAVRENGKRKLVLEHRYIMEQHIGRKLDRSECIHHKNGNKTDNRIENLEIIGQPEHSRMHFKYNPKFTFAGRTAWNKGKRSLVNVVCSICGTVFSRPAKLIRYNKKRNCRSVCSKICRARSAHQ